MGAFYFLQEGGICRTPLILKLTSPEKKENRLAVEKKNGDKDPGGDNNITSKEK